jgi:hypothetical protein
MFSNKFYYIKLLLFAGFILSGFVWSHKQGKDINPAFWVCSLRSDEFNGKRIWVPIAKVNWVQGEKAMISLGPNRIGVHGKLSELKEGKYISMTAIFRAGNQGTYLEPIKIRILRPNPLGRHFLEIVSLSVLGYVTFLFIRRFRITRPELKGKVWQTF